MGPRRRSRLFFFSACATEPLSSSEKPLPKEVQSSWVCLPSPDSSRVAACWGPAQGRPKPKLYLACQATYLGRSPIYLPTYLTLPYLHQCLLLHTYATHFARITTHTHTHRQASLPALIGTGLSWNGFRLCTPSQRLFRPFDSDREILLQLPRDISATILCPIF